VLVEVDDIPPAVQPLIAQALTANLLYVRWGADDGLGSGLAGYELLISKDGAPIGPWSTVQETSLLYPAEPGHSYTFSVVARDRAGNGSTAQQATVLAEAPAGLLYAPFFPR
jgi:hypothetical protein